MWNAPTVISDGPSASETVQARARADVAAGVAPRTRRLWDTVRAVFHHACDVDDTEIASAMLSVMETMLVRYPDSVDTNRRRRLEHLVAAHERLWHLRHPTRIE